MKKKKKKDGNWILWGIIVLLVVGFGPSVYRSISFKGKTEQVAPASSVEVITAGVNQYGLMVVFVKAPAPFSLHWEDKSGMVAEGPVTFENDVEWDIEMEAPPQGASGMVPVVKHGGKEYKGKPIP